VTTREERSGRPGDIGDATFRPGGSYEFRTERQHTGSGDSTFRPGSYEHITRDERRGLDDSADSGFRPGSYETFREERPGSYEYIREERRTTGPADRLGGTGSSGQFDVQFRRVGGPQRVSDEDLARGGSDEDRIRHSPAIRVPARDRRSFDDLLQDVVQLEL